MVAVVVVEVVVVVVMVVLIVVGPSVVVVKTFSVDTESMTDCCLLFFRRYLKVNLLFILSMNLLESNLGSSLRLVSNSFFGKIFNMFALYPST